MHKRTKQACGISQTALPTHPSLFFLTSRNVSWAVGKKRKKTEKQNRKGTKLKIAFILKTAFFKDTWHLDSLLESGAPTFVVGRSWLRFATRAAGERSQVQGGRAADCLLNSPAWRCWPVIYLPSADADPQQHMLTGQPLGGQATEVTPGREGQGPVESG